MMELLDFINTQFGFCCRERIECVLLLFLHHESTKKFLKIFREMLATCQKQ